MNIKVPKFLIRIVDKIFNRKKKVIPISIKIPTREELINNNENEKIALLDKYKKDYIEKLGSKLLFSIISSEKLINNYKMNQEITLKHLKDNKYNNVSDIIGNGNVKELLEVKLEFFKLFILTEQNKSLYNEIILRIAALNEISEEELIILPRKKRAILNEYDTLYTGLIVTTSSRYASIQDTEIYLIRMNEINKYIKNITNGEQKLLNERKELVIKIANIFIKDKLDSVLNSNVNDIGLIAYLEIELEKYLYEHKEEFTLLDVELNNIKNQNINKDNKEKLLKQIEILELKYLLLNLFSNVSKITFKKLYAIKFNFLTYNISILEDSPINKEDYGYEYYKKIVSNKINNFLNGNNSVFNNTFFCKGADKDFIDKCKSFYSDIDEVILGKFKLATLLSFDKEDGFNQMIDEVKLNRSDLTVLPLLCSGNIYITLKKMFNNELSEVKWNDEIPLSSVLQTVLLGKVQKGYREKTKINDSFLPVMFEMSKPFLSYKKLHDDKLKQHSHDLCIESMKLPEGIREINNSFSDDFFFPCLVYIMFNDCKKAINVILPDSIKKINGGAPYGFYIDYLPYGIEEINLNSYNIPPIPPTVKKMSITISDVENISLTFIDYKNSVFLRSEKNFVNLLNSLHKPGVKNITMALGYSGKKIQIRFYGDKSNEYKVLTRNYPGEVADEPMREITTYSYWMGYVYRNNIQKYLNDIIETSQIVGNYKSKSKKIS